MRGELWKEVVGGLEPKHSDYNMMGASCFPDPLLDSPDGLKFIIGAFMVFLFPHCGLNSKPQFRWSSLGNLCVTSFANENTSSEFYACAWREYSCGLKYSVVAMNVGGAWDRGRLK